MIIPTWLAVLALFFAAVVVGSLLSGILDAEIDRNPAYYSR